MSTDQRIIVELRLHDPDENDSIYDFYCDEPQRFGERLAAALTDYRAAHRERLAAAHDLLAAADLESAGDYLYDALEAMYYRGDPRGLRVHLAAHGITSVEDQPQRLVVSVPYYLTLEDAQDPSSYDDE